MVRLAHKCPRQRFRDGQREPSGCLHSSVASQRLNFVHPQPGALHLPSPPRAVARQNSQASHDADRSAYSGSVTITLSPAIPADTARRIAPAKLCASSATVGSGAAIGFGQPADFGMCLRTIALHSASEISKRPSSIRAADLTSVRNSAERPRPCSSNCDSEKAISIGFHGRLA